MWQIVSNALERSMKTARVISLVYRYFQKCTSGDVGWDV